MGTRGCGEKSREGPWGGRPRGSSRVAERGRKLQGGQEKLAVLAGHTRSEGRHVIGEAAVEVGVGRITHIM